MNRDCGRVSGLRNSAYTTQVALISIIEMEPATIMAMIMKASLATYSRSPTQPTTMAVPYIATLAKSSL